ncbi:MAG: hypothetical protein VXZ05_04505 [Pseudomonadota bacterium]|nr:hypothetical protein [Pseudomonadota bacterium]
MFHGFSRTSLIAIILGCLLTIVLLNTPQNPDEDTPLEPLKVAPLSDTGWSRYDSREGIPVAMQSRAGPTLEIRVHQQAPADLITLSVPLASDAAVDSQSTEATSTSWALPLKAALDHLQASGAAASPSSSSLSPSSSSPPSLSPSAIALSGPLSQPEMQQVSAYLIDRLALVAPSSLVPDANVQHASEALSHDIRTPRSLACEQQHPAGAWWYLAPGQTQPSDLGLAADLGLDQASELMPAPSRQTWQTFRQQQTKNLRALWLNDMAAIDIAARLAYHRLPTDFIRQRYLDLAQAQRTAPAEYVRCLHSSAVE